MGSFGTSPLSLSFVVVRAIDKETRLLIEAHAVETVGVANK